MTFDWHYDEGSVDISMPDNIPVLLKNLRYKLPERSLLTLYLIPNYTLPQKGQWQSSPAPAPDTFAILSPSKSNII